MNCKICGNTSEFFLKAPIFKSRLMIDYYRCSHCDFIQTEEPTWLDKAYSNVIAKTDIGLISRNMYNSSLLENILLHLFPNTDKCLDYGGGYGMFVRMMRDKGFDFYWQDDYCENLFAEGFEGSLDKKYDVITAFEVLEHLPQPMKNLDQILKHCNNFFFSTLLHDGVKDFENWWYRAEVSGQHIGFYSAKTMNWIAMHHGFHFYSFADYTLHLLAKNKIDEAALEAFLHPPKRTLKDRVLRTEVKTVKPRESLLTRDYEDIVKRQLG